MQNQISKSGIGGEFGINPEVLCGYPDYSSNNDILLYSSGRSALMMILNYINTTKTNVIHIPYYICGSVVKACKSAGFYVKFYELDENFLVPLEYISKIKLNEILLTVNYFGFTDNNPLIVKIRKSRPDITFISDHVQSYWTYQKTEADYSFTSLRKHFSIPEGALIYCKKDKIAFNSNIPESSFNKTKLLGAILKYMNFPDKAYLKFLEDGEKELDEELSISKASRLSHFLYENLDFRLAENKRKENCRFVYDFGQKQGLKFMFPYSKTIVPLTVPIFVKDRDEVRKEMITKNIFLPIHWPIELFNKHSKQTRNISSSILSLIIDQRYSLKDIKRQLEVLSIHI